MAAYTVVAQEERPDVTSTTISPSLDNNDSIKCTAISVCKAGSCPLSRNGACHVTARFLPREGRLRTIGRADRSGPGRKRRPSPFGLWRTPAHEGLARRSFSEGGWCRRRDLNPRPPAYEADALPLSYAGWNDASDIGADNPWQAIHRRELAQTASETVAARAARETWAAWSARAPGRDPGPNRDPGRREHAPAE